VAFAGSQGNFQLNVYKPIILYDVIDGIELLGEAVRSFDERCARGLAPDERVIAEHVERSLMLVTALVPHIGYEAAARIALTAHREHLSLRDAALRLGVVTAEQFDRWVRAEDMTRPLEGA
jgi:fumarate hydratase class II